MIKKLTPEIIEKLKKAIDHYMEEYDIAKYGYDFTIKLSDSYSDAAFNALCDNAKFYLRNNHVKILDIDAYRFGGGLRVIITNY